MSVPAIATLRADAADLIQRAPQRGVLDAIQTGAIAATVAGTPLDADATAQELITQCQPLIDQASSDVEAIKTRELLKLLAQIAVIVGGGAVFNSNQGTGHTYTFTIDDSNPSLGLGIRVDLVT